MSQANLWRDSKAWRWTVYVTVIMTCLCVFAFPWEVDPPLANAKYQPVIAPNSAVNRIASNRIVSSKSTPATMPTDAALEPRVLSFAPGTEMHIVGVYGPVKPANRNSWFLECHDKVGDNGWDLIKCQKQYEADHPQPNAQVINVDVQRSEAPVVLVLMAYESVTWNVAIAPGVNLRRVIISGYSGQDIQGIPTTVPVEVHSYKASPCSNCERQSGYFYAYKTGTREYSDAVNRLQAITGLAPSSFQGAYESNRFTINRWQGTDRAVPAPKKQL